jgi:hypothetical protein
MKSELLHSMMKSELLGSMMKSDSRMKLLALEQSSRIAQVFGSMVSMMSMMMLGQSSRKVGLRPEVEPRLHKPVLPEPDHSTLVPLEPSYSKPVLRLVLHYSRSVLVLLELHYSKPVLRLVLHYSKSMLVLLELHYSKLVLRLVLHYSRPVPKLPELKHSRH